MGMPTKTHAGRKFGAARHWVKVGPLLGAAVCVVAGRQKVYTMPGKAVAWLVRRGCPKKMAARLVKDAALTIHD
jgi:hypothetical protein